MMICVEDIFAGEKLFEKAPGNDELRLRQICRRKSLWILPGHCWFASKTILQAKRFLKFFRIMMICVEKNFAAERVFEYFQDNDDLRPRQFCKRKSLWMFSG